MSQIMEWNYAHDADITFGEVHVSKLPKIMLTILITLLICLGSISFIFRDYLIDYIKNPQLTLKDSVYNVETNQNEIYVEVYTEFDPLDYVSINLDKVNFEYNVIGEVDTYKLGDYKITYKSKNKVRENISDVIVHVVDKTEPIITLDTTKVNVDSSEGINIYSIVLVRGKDTDSFNDKTYKSYVKEVTDNYSKSKNIKLEYTKLEFNSTNSAQSIVYTATDENGNTGSIKLLVSIQDDYDAQLKEQEELIAKMEEELKALQNRPTQNNNNSGSTGNNNGGNSNGGNSNGGNTEQSIPQQTGLSLTANPVTVSIDAGPLGVYQACAANAFYRGSGTAYPSNMPGQTFQLEPGTYTVTWQCTEGLTCEQIVTITD